MQPSVQKGVGRGGCDAGWSLLTGRWIRPAQERGNPAGPILGLQRLVGEFPNNLGVPGDLQEYPSKKKPQNWAESPSQPVFQKGTTADFTQKGPTGREVSLCGRGSGERRQARTAIQSFLCFIE